MWPLKARKSTVQRLHVDRQVRHALRGVDQHQRAGRVAPARTISATGLIVPSVFETAATATSFVRSVSSRVERVHVEPAVVGERNVPQHGAGALGRLLPRHEIRVVLHHREQHFVAGAQVRIAPTAGDAC